jgi:hypothetical protein
MLLVVHFAHQLKPKATWPPSSSAKIAEDQIRKNSFRRNIQ